MKHLMLLGHLKKELRFNRKKLKDFRKCNEIKKRVEATAKYCLYLRAFIRTLQ